MGYSGLLILQTQVCNPGSLSGYFTSLGKGMPCLELIKPLEMHSSICGVHIFFKVVSNFNVVPTSC